jgi:hypothetical protein
VAGEQSKSGGRSCHGRGGLKTIVQASFAGFLHDFPKPADLYRMVLSGIQDAPDFRSSAGELLK